MSKRRVCLIWLLLIIAIICCSTHTSGGQEDDSVNISYPSSLSAKGEVSHEDILNHTQSSLDRSISIHNTVAIVMGLLVALITLIVGIGSVVGYLKIRQLEENIAKAKSSAEKTEGYEAEAKKAAENVKHIGGLLKNYYKDTRDVLGVEIIQFPSLPEPLSKDQKGMVYEYERKIGDLEAIGVPLESEDYFNRGVGHYQRGKYASALEAFDKAIELNNDFAEAWNSKGVILSNLGRYDEALKAFDRAMDLKPKFAFAWSNKGVALDNLGRYEEALEAYEEVIDLNPDFAKGWYNKGVALGNLGRYGEALEAYDQAINLEHKYHEAWYNKGCAYSRKDDKENALEMLSEAIKLDAKYKEMAKSDKAFINYWADEDFKRIVS